MKQPVGCGLHEWTASSCPPLGLAGCCQQNFVTWRTQEYNTGIHQPGGSAMSTAHVEIVECTTPQQRDEFIFFQWVPYRGNSYWVPPLISERREFYDPARHPFHQHAT